MTISKKLEIAVLTKSPQEAADICKKMDHCEDKGRALGLACRFGGMEYVKALVENGATFGNSSMYYGTALLNINKVLVRTRIMIKDKECFSDKKTYKYLAAKTLYPLSEKKRIEIVKYLCECKERDALDLGKLLYYSIITRNKEIAAVLKEAGVTLSQSLIEQITENNRNFMWNEYTFMMGVLTLEEFLDVSDELFNEIGRRPLGYGLFVSKHIFIPNSDSIWEHTPDLFKFVIDRFNGSKMNKTEFMRLFIDQNDAARLEMCADKGWLKATRKRDEMIEYATKNNRTEALAWLLDFKHRTADLAAERAKAEKKAERELNANPNSVTELKKTWSFKKQEDGTLIITSYKGRSTDITVPSKIGKDAVAAIGSKAFSPDGPRLSPEQKDARSAIERVRLPDGIRLIGEKAFFRCGALTTVNIPDGAQMIGSAAFGRCKMLPEIDLPDTVIRLSERAFIMCSALVRVKLSPAIDVIEFKTFYGCDSLEEVTIPEGVKTITKYSFANCANLRSVVIPASVEEMNGLYFTENKESLTPHRILLVPLTGSGSNEGVFENSENITVTVEPKSYAERYCKDNMIRIQYSK